MFKCSPYIPRSILPSLIYNNGEQVLQSLAQLAQHLNMFL